MTKDEITVTIEGLQMAIDDIAIEVAHLTSKEGGGRPSAIVKTKLDEARLWCSDWISDVNR